MKQPRNQEEIDEYLDKIISKAERDIDKVFAARLKEIKAMIGKLFEKYSNKAGELTPADVAKYNRLEKEMKLIKENLKSDYKAVMKAINKLMETQYIENYMRSAYLYEMYTGKEMGFSAPSLEAIKQAAANPIPQLTLPAILERYRVELVNAISLQIAQGLLAGEGYAQIAKRVHGQMQLSLNKARLTARTEAHRVQVSARMDSAEHAAKHVKMEKMWSAALDTRTRLGHRKLDGKTVPINGLFKSIYGGIGKGPGHMHRAKDDCNCRCAIVYVVDGIKPDLRRARAGKGSKVIPYVTYAEWEKSHKKLS